MKRRRSAGETRDGEIEASPEEMDGAYFAYEAAAENLEDAVDLKERAPESMCGSLIVPGVDMIL